MYVTPPPALSPEAPTIRPVVPEDIIALKAVIDACGLFPAEMLDDMTADYFRGDAGGDFWLTADAGEPAAVAYCAPERMTQGAWNLLLIAVHPGSQGRGIGGALLREVERSLVAQGERVLLVETSGLPTFARTRDFYRKHGYGEEARIRDYYQEGEDKIVFRKLVRGADQ
jgi:ribosomal protein S18 acetylase RimI-like enzyme